MKRRHREARMPPCVLRYSFFRRDVQIPLSTDYSDTNDLFEHRKLLDGGIADSIPLKYFESIGYNKNIVLLTQPKGFVKQKNKVVG